MFATGGGPGLAAIRSPRFAAFGGAGVRVVRSSGMTSETGKGQQRAFYVKVPSLGGHWLIALDCLERFRLPAGNSAG